MKPLWPWLFPAVPHRDGDGPEPPRPARGLGNETTGASSFSRPLISPLLRECLRKRRKGSQKQEPSVFSIAIIFVLWALAHGKRRKEITKLSQLSHRKSCSHQERCRLRPQHQPQNAEQMQLSHKPPLSSAPVSAGFHKVPVKTVLHGKHAGCFSASSVTWIWKSHHHGTLLKQEQRLGASVLAATLAGKNLFLTPSLNLPCPSSVLFPRVPREKRSAPAPPLPSSGS